MEFFDIHHHIIPPGFEQIWLAKSNAPPGLKLPGWSIEETLEIMHNTNTRHAILSLGHQVPHFVEDEGEAATICRNTNEYLASLRDQHPSMLGFFATLPSPWDTKRCMEEVVHSLDNLKADGVVLATSYGGSYLGEDAFKQIWHVLNLRGTVVLIHPGADGHTGGLPPGKHPIPGRIIDWSHETTRTATHLIATGRKGQCRNCKIVLSHAGGTLPFVAERIGQVAAQTNDLPMDVAEFVREARSFYFDLAVSGFDTPLRTVRDFAEPGHVLYGCDFPFVQRDLVETQHAKILAICESEDPGENKLVEAALNLFPRFRQ